MIIESIEKIIAVIEVREIFFPYGFPSGRLEVLEKLIQNELDFYAREKNFPTNDD